MWFFSNQKCLEDWCFPNSACSFCSLECLFLTASGLPSCALRHFQIALPAVCKLNKPLLYGYFDSSDQFLPYVGYWSCVKREVCFTWTTYQLIGVSYCRWGLDDWDDGRTYTGCCDRWPRRWWWKSRACNTKNSNGIQGSDRRIRRADSPKCTGMK